MAVGQIKMGWRVWFHDALTRTAAVIATIAVLNLALITFVTRNHTNATKNMTSINANSSTPSIEQHATSVNEIVVDNGLSSPELHYPTSRKPPCIWHSNALNDVQISCVRMQGKVIGVADKYLTPFRFPYYGLWCSCSRLCT
jgi:hypothetical protein